MDDSNQDPFPFFPEFSRISISQQELLHRTPIVGDTSLNSHHHDTPSQFDAEVIPVSSVPVVVLSPPDTNQDVFLTPPEDESLLPSFDDDVPHCSVNQPVGVYDESQMFVDLAGVSELGFPDGGGLVGESRVLERDISELGQVPVKNAMENVSENVEMQNAEVVEGSGEWEEMVLRFLQNELESGKYEGEEKSFLFDVLKILSDNSKGDEVDDDDVVDGLTVLEAGKHSGITFSRPSWWLDHYVSKLFNFNDDDDDQVKE